MESPTILGTLQFAMIIMLVIMIILIFGKEFRPLIELIINWIIGMVKK